MVQRLAILGSTGSVGSSTLDVVSRHPERYEVRVLTAGRNVDVLVEQHNPGSGEMIGRCARFAPEVDGEVLIQPGENGLQAGPGTMVPVQITGSDVYDLTGRIVGASDMVAAARGAS